VTSLPAGAPGDGEGRAEADIERALRQKMTNAITAAAGWIFFMFSSSMDEGGQEMKIPCRDSLENTDREKGKKWEHFLVGREMAALSSEAFFKYDSAP
jgi:hypothetical protein